MSGQRKRLEKMASLASITIERLRSSNLSAQSHDLRTPLTALVGLADSLAVIITEPGTMRALNPACRPSF